MLTQAEVNNLLKGVNAAFAEDRKRLDKLEEAVKALQEAQKAPAKASKKDANNVE